MIRVFPRRTTWTPDDKLAFVGDPPLFRPLDQPVKISVAFIWDIPEAERLLQAWGQYYSDIEMGGPALGSKGEEFIQGRFVKPGMTFTSRGCPNRCWFCSVWERDPEIKELPIVEGWNVADDNILACSAAHFRRVCEMLKTQKERVVFSGGLEATRLTFWHASLLVSLKPDRLYFAYDTPEDYEPLVEAGKIMREAGIPEAKHILFSYVLMGYDGDTFELAEKRLLQTIGAGFTPMAMLWRDKYGNHKDRRWLKFQRQWARPRLIYKKKGGLYDPRIILSQAPPGAP